MRIRGEKAAKWSGSVTHTGVKDGLNRLINAALTEEAMVRQFQLLGLGLLAVSILMIALRWLN